MTNLLARLAILLRMAPLIAATRNAARVISDCWLALQIETACWYSWRLAPADTCDRARMYGEVFRLTGNHVTGWPCRYMLEYVDGQANAGQRPL
jgi:hypothetical protein